MRGFSKRTSIGIGIMPNKNAVLEFLNSVFVALWYTVDGTSMNDMLGNHDPLTLSAAPGTSYIPATFAGTITPPDTAALKTSDPYNYLYENYTGTPKDLSVSDLIDEDLDRVPVKYDPEAPHHIRMIGLIDNSIYDSLTDADKKKISDYMDLWIYYWKQFLGGETKENRNMDDYANVAPQLTPIADQAEYAGSGPWVIDLANHFTDPNDDTLTYRVVSNSHPSVVTTSIDGSELTLTEVGAGNTTIQVGASDGEKETTDIFLFSVVTP